MSLREGKDFEEVYCSSQAKLGQEPGNRLLVRGCNDISCCHRQPSRSLCQQHGQNRQNWPFPSSKKSHFQSEAKCEAIDMKMIFNYDANKTHFHNKGFALRLVLKVRFFGTRRWPIGSIGARLRSASTIYDWKGI